MDKKNIRLYNDNSDILIESNTSCPFASFPNVSEMKQMDRKYDNYHKIYSGLNIFKMAVMDAAIF